MFVLVQTVAAFPDGERGGNPAGVVVDANGLSREQKQTVARRVGLSETAFVSISSIASCKLDFFTPTRQIPHCGHATIAAFYLLRQLGLVDDGPHSKETIDGTRRIQVDGGVVFMEQRAPRYAPVPVESGMGERVLTALAISRDRLADGPGPFVVDTGNAFLVLPLDEPSLARLRPDLDLIEAISGELDLIGFYPFSSQTRGVGRHASARMFAPRFGIPEEAATGAAAGGLACYLRDKLGVEDRRILVEQGRLMESPSPSLLTIDLTLESGSVSSLMVGGTARPLSRLRIEV